jgi:hypothetical protein
MKKIGTTTLIFLLALVWHAPGILVQGPNERAQDKMLSAQLPSPIIELAGQIGGDVNNS